MGTPSNANPGFSFGVNNPSTASGFSLGSAGTLFTSTTLSSATGATPLTGTNTFTGFGTNQNALKQGFSFGQAATPASNQTPTGTSTILGGFGNTAQTGGTGIGTFNTPSATPLGGSGIFGGFGTTTTPASQPLGFGGFGTLSTANTVPSFGLGSTLTTQAPFGSGGFGATSSLGTGIFGTSAMPTATSTSLSTLGLGGLGGGCGAVQTAAVTGLGGIGVSHATASAIDAAKSDSKTLKEYPVPPEIGNLMEDFKKYMKDQKSTREEISRVSSKQLVKVKEETVGSRQQLSLISNGVARNMASIRQLKQETAQELKNVEIMLRTKDISLAMQYENTAPMAYFQQIIADFETKMKIYGQQIGMMEQQLASITRPATFSPQEFAATIRKLYETFVYLAAELQTIHEAVENLKDRYVAYRQDVYGDNTSMFESRSKSLSSKVQTPVTLGPSAFTNSSTAGVFALTLEKAQQPSGAPPTIGLSSGSLNASSLGIMQGLGSGSLHSSGFQTSNSVMAVKPLGSSYASQPTPSFGVSNEPIQLQRPPVGNKRGKR